MLTLTISHTVTGFHVACSDCPEPNRILDTDERDTAIRYAYLHRHIVHPADLIAGYDWDGRSPYTTPTKGGE